MVQLNDSQSINRVTDVTNKFMVTKGGKRWWYQLGD